MQVKKEKSVFSFLTVLSSCQKVSPTVHGGAPTAVHAADRHDADTDQLQVYTGTLQGHY